MGYAERANPQHAMTNDPWGRAMLQERRTRARLQRIADRCRTRWDLERILWTVPADERDLTRGKIRDLTPHLR